MNGADVRAVRDLLDELREDGYNAHWTVEQPALTVGLNSVEDISMLYECCLENCRRDFTIEISTIDTAVIGVEVEN
jgi:hypothetical protein